MKFTEFYEKHLRINGKKPAPLTDEEKLVYDMSEKLKVNPFVRIWTRKHGFQSFINPIIIEELKKKI